MARADPAQVRALVGAVYTPTDRRTAMAVRAEAVWPGDEALDGGPVPTRVVACPSPLAVRAALVDHHDHPGELLVVLTPCAEEELGADVMTRLLKGRVLAIEPYTAVRSLFGARVLDPLLVREKWLVEDLIALAPPGGWPERRPFSGVLDVDLAWATWQHDRLGLAHEPADLDEVLALGADARVVAGLRDLAPARRDAVAARWAAGAPPVALVVGLLAADGVDPVVVGLVLRVLWAPVATPGEARAQELARARFEHAVPRGSLTAAAALRWADAAERTATTNGWVTRLDEAERLLGSLDASSLVALSDVLPGAFDARLRAFAGHLGAGRADDAAGALDALARHAAAGSQRHRVDTARAALRLHRWLDRPAGPGPTSFAAACADEAGDGAWADDAHRLVADGDHDPAVAAVYAALAAQVRERRAASTGRFEGLLVEWSAAEPVPDARIVALEHLLDTVVVPVARAAPVLVVVCDGMALAVAHRLLADLHDRHWRPAGLDPGAPWPVGVALLPTVTEVSRASLLAGSRTVGGPAQEKAGFGAHPGLRAVSAPQRPPVLLHKGDLVAPSGLALPEAVRSGVADPDQRVVGVIVNAVDDFLDRGDQLRVAWGLDTVKPLGWLLDAAAEAGRVVVLTADHGHVLHTDTSQRRAAAGGNGGGDSGVSGNGGGDGDGGERWRPADTAVRDGERLVAGPRVLRGGGRVIVPSGADTHFAGHKHGYHGGITPQEVLVPVEVLARRLPEGWAWRPAPAPSWWTGYEQPAAAPVTAAPAAAPAAKGRAGAAQASLFDPTPAPAASGDWVGALVAHPLVQAQAKRLPRPVPADRVALYLRTIHVNGDTIPLAALAARCGDAEYQARLTLTMLQRLVNLDGSACLTVIGDTAELNVNLLVEQFGVDAS